MFASHGIVALTTYCFGNVRNCSPRSSPTPDIDPNETQLQAEWAWETLSKMGGRPTRPILFDTTRDTKVVDGYIYMRDEDGCEHSIDEHKYNWLHWSLERERFNQELNDWKDFRKEQQQIHEKQQMNGGAENGEPQHREQRPHAFTLEEQKASEMEWDRHEQELKDWKESRDAQWLVDQSQQGKRAEKKVNLQEHELERESRFAANLTLLKDWRQFRTYREQRFVDYHRRRIKGCERRLRALQREMDDATTEKIRENLSRRRKKIRSDIFCQQLDLRRKKILLKRVKQQLPAILSECINSTSGSPTSRHKLEEACELEARQVHNTLIEMGGRPTRPIRPVSNTLNPEQTDDLLHILHYWDNEYLHFEGELDLWKKFRYWQQQPCESQQKNGTQGNAVPEQLKQPEQWSLETLTKLNDWKYFLTFQQWRVNLAKERVDVWERELDIGRQEAKKTFEVFRQEKVNDAESSVDFCQRDLESAQARGKADDGWFSCNPVNPHPWTYEEEIGFLRGRLDRAYEELEEVGNNKTHLEFKRYGEKCDSDVKDAQDNIERVREQLRIEESRLEWTTQQIPFIYPECTTVYSIGEVSLPDHLENARIVQSDHNSLGDVKPIMRRRQRHTSKKTPRPTKPTVLGPVHSPKISKSKKRGPALLYQQPSITKGGATRQPIDKTKTAPRSVIDNVPRRSKRIADRREKPNALESCLLLDSNMNVTFSHNKTSPCRSEQLSKDQRLDNPISRPVVQQDPQRRMTRLRLKGQDPIGGSKITNPLGSHRITKRRDRKLTQSWKAVKGRLKG